MVLDSQIIATATASFILGWVLRKSNFVNLFRKRTLLDPQEDLKLVVVVRADLGMKRGKIAAQSCHAALACYKQGMVVCPDIIKQWELQGEKKIVLQTEYGKASLKQISQKAANVGLVAALIRDAGRTQLPRGMPTAVGIGPGRSADIDQLTGGLKLL